MTKTLTLTEDQSSELRSIIQQYLDLRSHYATAEEERDAEELLSLLES